MGNQLGVTGSSTITPREHQIPQPPINLSPDQIRIYEDIRNEDQQIRQFDTDLHLRTTRTINTLSIETNQPLPFSLDLLKEVTGCLLDSNQQVVNLILTTKKDIWKNPDLFTLVDDYFKTSLHTLDFCSTLQRFLANSKLNQAILRSALHRLSETEFLDPEEYRRAILDLQRFKSEQTHFTEEVLKKFGTVYDEHIEMLSRLQSQRSQLDKKLKKVRAWRKTASVVFAVTFATVLICSIVVAAVTAPPMVTAIVTAVSGGAAWVPTESWFGALWRKFEGAVQEQSEVVSAVEAGTVVVMRDLDNIRVLVEGLEAELESFVGEVERGIRGEEGFVFVGVKEIERRVGVFTSSVDELGEYVDCCSRNVHKARSVVLQRIMKPKRT
ncbi:hypothetical protein Syun_014756 [Stephania yunnanensis]|uniref:Uncharacterized protein n=1 Tax=Stephania yunnanensis TaxID=152371 RepID=A0AAP0JJX5_9MAGN